MKRSANGRSSIYQTSDGYWHGRVSMGVRDDGKPDRRHVERTSKAAVVARIKELENQRDEGRVRRPGKAWTVEEWLTHWLEQIARPNVRATSYDAYRVAVNRFLIPGLGAHKLHKLEPEHLERLYARMIEKGSRPGRVHQIHRTARTAFGEAHRRGRITTNPAAVAKAPRVTGGEVKPYTLEEVHLIFDEAGKRRNTARWAIALSLGLRQGEALALQWADIDFAAKTIQISRTRLRPAYAHGCKAPCGRRRAGYCPERKKTNSHVGETKSTAGQRTIGLPDQLVELLHQQRAAQIEERRAARQLWSEGKWVFASPTGEPLNPNSDYVEWRALLKSAGVRDARLHDARHTAATMLLALEVAPRAVMGVMGWSSMSMAERYQHVTDPIREDIARRVGGLLWTPKDGGSSPGEAEPDEGSAGALVPA